MKSLEKVYFGATRKKRFSLTFVAESLALEAFRRADMLVLEPDIPTMATMLMLMLSRRAYSKVFAMVARIMTTYRTGIDQKHGMHGIEASFFLISDSKFFDYEIAVD